MRLPMPAIAMALSCLADAAPSFGQRNAPPPKPQHAVEYRLATNADAARLEIVIADVASARSQRRSITDLMLRFSLADGDVGEALRLPNGTVADRDAGLMRAEVYIVSGGRLLRETEARCDRWIGDVAICKAGCDGGAFGLQRANGQLSLVLGVLPRGDGDKKGFSIEPCQDASVQEPMLVPANGRDRADLALRGSQMRQR